MRKGLLLLCVLALGACSDTDHARDGRVILHYWEKWNGPEAEAMRAVVNDFNASQDRIYVDYSSVSQMDRRLMLAIAGGVPPDVAGMYGKTIPVYAENNALLPLDKLATAAGVKREQYIDAFWQICFYRDHLWALPSTPDSIALVWNKKLFREAGLDPERAPTSIAELEQFNEKLIRRRPDGHLASCGFLPSEPGWWRDLWGLWFGATLWDGGRHLTIDTAANTAAFQWVASYPERYGAEDLLRFHDGFGNFASSQNPFFTGRVAMVLQGPWIANFIRNLAPPGFEWGAAPFPSNDPAQFQNVTYVETDVLAIPAGAKHPREAFTFIAYVNSRKPMEKLCLAQCKFTPLRECSPDFFQHHPNPYISTFLDLAKSPNAHTAVPLTTIISLTDDMNQAFDSIWAGKVSVGDALKEVQIRQQETLDDRLHRWDRMSAVLTQEWNRP